LPKRKNTFTGFIGDIVDDTKEFVDDLLDRAKDVEAGVRDAVKDAIDDEPGDRVSASSPDVAELQAALAELTRKVNQLAELQAVAPANPAATTTSSSRRTAAA
jgi:hypothetical protein